MSETPANPIIESVHFENFRVLRDATLPLGRLTVLIGPNGSGKSTALQGLGFSQAADAPYQNVVSAGAAPDALVRVTQLWNDGVAGEFAWLAPKHSGPPPGGFAIHKVPKPRWQPIPTFCLIPDEIRRAVQLSRLATDSSGFRSLGIQPSGRGLALALTNLQDRYPDRFEKLNRALNHWMPEIHRFLLVTPDNGQRSFQLRTKAGHDFHASELSEGTLLTVALLVLAYLPNPPPAMAFEEPDRGIHPRMLRLVYDALNHLAFPESAEDDREPVQVVVTTHSPYFVNLFRDRPEDIVIAERHTDGATFKRLTDQEHWKEIVRGAALGELWYSGILGGVPLNT